MSPLPFVAANEYFLSNQKQFQSRAFLQSIAINGSVSPQEEVRCRPIQAQQGWNRHHALMIYEGAGRRIRTDDLLITNQLLYQLSYAGNDEGNSSIGSVRNGHCTRKLYPFPGQTRRNTGLDGQINCHTVSLVAAILQAS
jgi:hypothetical protein